ncbi:hypothetical protein BW723_11350 [Polaribacter reichenbachii]|uniref:DUF4199 domain-containing protein n=1 Tax=Polaribacter reichenbachii TaxID=996801 RepID=A0A1B8TPR3_9FLAO|nr:hypothetical protein [Polaribacter reichenbachii]APZ46841.1 hypothetical protein BW723_11350 [Polaribacter reichenbachii]AUC17484.1 hypothetical protein BTO17_01795 [Polaribacter reichenbachii]OBY61640.1 hypothetical protein LPB301_16420 [Polaribacter reichenbachii]
MKQTNIILRNAILITALIAGLFFLSKLFGLQENPYLRFLNLLFVVYGIRQAVKTNIEVNKETNYITNLGLGLQTSALAVIFSVIGVVTYIEFINPEFLLVMENSFLIGGNLSVPEIFITLLIEGMASTFVGSFVVMMFYKNHDKVIATAQTSTI